MSVQITPHKDNTVYLKENDLIILGMNHKDTLNLLTQLWIKVIACFTCFTSKAENKIQDYYKEHAIKHIKTKNLEYLNSDKKLISRQFNSTKSYFNKGINVAESIQASQYAKKELEASIEYLDRCYENQGYFLLEKKENTQQKDTILKISKEVRRSVKLELASSEHHFSLIFKWAPENERQELARSLAQMLPQLSAQKSSRIISDPVHSEFSKTEEDSSTISEEEILPQPNMFTYFSKTDLETYRKSRIKEPKSEVIEEKEGYSSQSSSSESEVENTASKLSEVLLTSESPKITALDATTKTTTTTTTTQEMPTAEEPAPLEVEVEVEEVDLEASPAVTPEPVKLSAEEHLWNRVQENPTETLIDVMTSLLEFATKGSPSLFNAGSKKNLEKALRELAPLIDFMAFSKMREHAAQITLAMKALKQKEKISRTTETKNFLTETFNKNREEAKEIERNKPSFWGTPPDHVKKARENEKKRIKEKFDSIGTKHPFNNIITTGQISFARLGDKYFADAKQKSESITTLKDLFTAVSTSEFATKIAAKVIITTMTNDHFIKKLEVELALVASDFSIEKTKDSSEPLIKAIFSLNSFLKRDKAKIESGLNLLSEMLIPILKTLDEKFNISKILEKAKVAAEKMEKGTSSAAQVVPEMQDLLDMICTCAAYSDFLKEMLEEKKEK